MSITFYNRKQGCVLVIEDYPEFGQWTKQHSDLVNLICNCMGWTYMPTHDKGVPLDMLQEVFKQWK